MNVAADSHAARRPSASTFALNLFLELLPTRLAKLTARGFRCEPGTMVKTPTRLSIGEGVTLQRRCLLHCGGRSWSEYRGSISLGDHVVIGPNCILYGAGVISVGEYSHMGPGSMIITQAGVVEDQSRFSVSPKMIHEPVHVGKGVWIGAGAVLLGGTNLGDGCTVSPNSVVVGDYEPGTTLVGNPARVARALNIR